MSRRVFPIILLLSFAAEKVGTPAFAAEATAPRTDVKIDGHYGNWYPPDVSKHGYQIDRLIDLVHWFMAALFVGWGIFFVYCLVRFRQRTGQPADYQPVKAKVSKYSEIAVAAIEAVFLLGFSIPIWASVKNDIPGPESNPVHVRVIAEQFAWNFHYPGKDGIFGPTSPKLVDLQKNPAGIDKAHEHGKDDVVAQEFHIPVNRGVICDISSKDVIHSFFVPVLRVKQDAIPGMRIPMWFEAKDTGNYEVACAQLCGNNHYSMRALMVIQSESEFAAWLEEKAKPPEEFEEDSL